MGNIEIKSNKNNWKGVTNLAYISHKKKNQVENKCLNTMIYHFGKHFQIKSLGHGKRFENYVKLGLKANSYNSIKNLL
jgi:hypothetical protein